MKESIDLTENRDFRGNGIKKSAGYPHKNLPWEPAGDLEPANRKPQIIDNVTTTMRWSTFFDNTRTNRITITDYGDIFSETTSNDFITGTSYDYFYSDSGTFANVKIDREGNVTYLLNSKYYEPLSIFPIGKRDYIRTHRLKDYVPSKCEKRRYLCTKCKTTVITSPWRLCEKCANTVHKKNNKNRIVWRPDNIKFRPYGLKRNITIFGTVPCLSKRLPMEKKIKSIPKRNKDWDYMDDYEFYIKELRFKLRSKVVYHKGMTLRRRAEPWQPEGRVRQAYDELFDNTDWRDMLRKRIGELDKNNILKNDGIYISTIENIINEISTIV